MKVVDIKPASPLGRSIWQLTRALLISLLAFPPLLILNISQILTLLILPFSKPTFRRCNRWLAWAIWGWWAMLMDRLIGLEVHISGDTLPDQENAIVVANHQSMSDILVLLCLASRFHSVDRVKWMVKDALKYVPGIGWGMQFIQCIFLKRNWVSDKSTIAATFHSVISEKTPIWLMLFPEGTRFQADKLVQSNNFARKAGHRETSYVLQPRVKGFCAAAQGLGEHVQDVYSICIGFHGRKTPGLWSLIQGDVRKVSLMVKRTPLKEIGRDSKSLTQWLTQDFQTKDELLRRFNKTQQFELS